MTPSLIMLWSLALLVAVVCLALVAVVISAVITQIRQARAPRHDHQVYRGGGNDE